MASNAPDESPERRPRPLRNALIIAGLAFLIGALVMGWAFTRWAPARALVAAEAPEGMPAAPEPQTVAALPAAPVAAAPDQNIAPMLAPSDATMASRVSEMEGRIARIDLRAAAAAGNADRAEGLLLAFAARRAIDRGMGLGYVEGQLTAHFGSAQPRAVAAVIAAAQSPATLAILRQQLDAVAPTLAGTAATQDWWGAARQTLATLVIVRRETAVSPAPDDRLARARLMLDAGQVDAAMAEVARLPGAAAAQSWMATARRHIEAHRALDILEAAAIMPPPPGALTPVQQ
jgi:hypothetical protein